MDRRAPRNKPEAGRGFESPVRILPQKDYDETNDREWTDIQEYALCIYTYFTADGKICDLDDQGYHMRVVEENRGRRCVTFYGVRGEDALCANGYHRGEVICQEGAGILNGPFIFRESFLEKEMIQEMS